MICLMFLLLLLLRASVAVVVVTVRALRGLELITFSNELLQLLFQYVAALLMRRH